MMDGNTPDSLQANAYAKKQANLNLTTLFIFLIIILFYLVPLIAWAAGKNPNKYTDYLFLYTTVSYTIVVSGIIIFHDKGLDVLRDRYSLWTIVVTCFLAALQGGERHVIYRVILILLGLRLSIHIVTNRENITVPTLKSVLFGLLWSASTIVIIAIPLTFSNPNGASLPSNLLPYILNTFLFQITFVTVIEEACFRGLLFGLLVMNGYQEDRSLFIQTILFWGVHYLKIPDIPRFFVAIPLLAISLMLITKKYKLLYLSVMVHTFANVLGPILVVVLQNSIL